MKWANTGTRPLPSPQNANRARFSKPLVAGSNPAGSAILFLQQNAVSSPYSRDIIQTHAQTSVRTLVSVRYGFMMLKWHALARSNQ
jgi:hypothetical protein